MARTLSALALVLIAVLGGGPACAQGREAGREVAARKTPARPAAQEHHVHTKACRRWEGGGTRYVTERVWVPGSVERVWIPPVYRDETRHGGAVRVLVRKGHYDTVKRPGSHRLVKRKVKTVGRWVYACGH